MSPRSRQSPQLRGRVWLFGDGVNTDELYPGFAMKLPIAEAARHMFDATRPDWPSQVQPGDIVVGGRRFGMGSSRPVPLLFQALGVSCVLADEFNSLFLRNCINYGLPALDIAGVRAVFEEGQEAAVDLSRATVTNASTGARLIGTPYPDFILEILAYGGIIGRLTAEGYIRDRS